jgi:hypothetical protein
MFETLRRVFKIYLIADFGVRALIVTFMCIGAGIAVIWFLAQGERDAAQSSLVVFCLFAGLIAFGLWVRHDVHETNRRREERRRKLAEEAKSFDAGSHQR